MPFKSCASLMQVIITRYGGDVNLNHTCLDREAADILISRDDN